MTSIRAKIATAATVVGLAGLGGFAMASNPARDAPAGAAGQVAAAQTGSVAAAQTGSAPATSHPVVTGTSGATATTVPVANTQSAAATQPVPAAKRAVTHTSGGAAGSAHGHTFERDNAPARYED